MHQFGFDKYPDCFQYMTFQLIVGGSGWRCLLRDVLKRNAKLQKTFQMQHPEGNLIVVNISVMTMLESGHGNAVLEGQNLGMAA